VTGGGMKILLTGSSGQVGWELRRTLPPLGEVVALDRSAMDFTRIDELRHVLREMRPDVVVNAAAYTAVDKAESEPELARLVNAVAPRVLAEEVRATGGLLVHYSTDYVFDGTQQRPYTEDDEPAPLGAYGASKLEGERAIQAVGGAHLIFRTSWVYGIRGKNFLLTMLNLFEDRDELKIVDDQIGAPTWCRWLAESTAQVLAQCVRGEGSAGRLAGDRSGIYHLTAGGTTSWFGFASAILDLHMPAAGATRPELVPIPSAAYPLPAKRPANSVLSNAKLRAAFGVVQPPWDSLLRRCMAELTPR
jgi:dTDP-4-dehydrorhamnose reductase